ncbi:MAG: MFS transporter [Sporolactobacillus sp.]
MLALASLHRNIKLRLVVSFLSVFVDNMVFPFMAMYLSRFFGAFRTGLFIFLTLLLSSSASLLGGYLSDRFGRKSLLIGAQLLLILSFAGMTWANSPWQTAPLVTLPMLLIEAAASGIRHPAEEAMLIDVSDSSNRRLMYSINYWSTNLGMAGGAVIGGLFFAHDLFYLFLALFGSSLVILVLIFIFLEEVYQRPTQRREAPPHFLAHYRPVLRDHFFLLFCLGNCLVLSLEFQTTNAIAVHLQQNFATTRIAGITLTSYRMLSWMRIENTLLVVILAWVLAHLVHNLSLKNIFTIGLPIYVIGYAAQFVSSHFAGLSLAVLIATIGELIYVPASQTLLASMTKQQARAAYMAIYGFVFQGAKFLGAAGIVCISAFSPLVTGLVMLLIGTCGLFCYLKVCATQLQTRSKP